MCNCGSAAKHLVNKKKINYEEIDSGKDDNKREEMLKKSNGAKTIPKIFIGEKQVKCVKSLDAYQTKHSFDVVTLWGVLEHLPNGEHAFELARKVFKKRGLILFLVPNLQSRAFRFLGANTPTLNPREHINFYSAESIEKLAGRHGFNFVASFDELPVIDLMWDFMDGADDHIISDIIEKGESYYRVYIYEYSESR